MISRKSANPEAALFARSRALLWLVSAFISFNKFCFFVENLALNKPVKQSSTYSIHNALDAVNGIIYGINEFSHTDNAGGNQWWRIDLGKLQTVKVVELYVRTDREGKLTKINKYYV